MGAADGVSDDNIDQIKAYIDALKDVDVKNLCTKAERDDIVSDNKDTYDKASSATDTYLMNEQKEVTDLKLKVNDDIKLLKEINQKLEDRNEPPVSTVAVSTYKIDPTVPAGGETSPAGEKSTPADGATSMPTSDGGMTSKPPSDGKTSPAGEMSSKPSSDGETSPAGGMTSKPPSDGQTSPSAGVTTKPDGGETSKPPTGGETSKPPTGGETSKSPTGGETSKPPTGGESTPSKPGAVSTAKPQRNLFERKRSR